MTKDKFLRIDDVMAFTGLAKSTVWQWVKEKKLPAPIKLSPKVTVWKQSDLEDWFQNQDQRQSL